MQMVLAVASGGAIGAVARYWVAGLALRWMGPQFPWGTLTVNVVGSFLMGLLIAFLALRTNVSPELRAFLLVGVLGGFTTFSAFSLDVSVLVERKDMGAALLYVFGSVVLSIGALFLGLYLTRQWTP